MLTIRLSTPGRRADREGRQYRALGLVLVVLVSLGAACASTGEREEAKKKRERTVLATRYDDMRVGTESAKGVEAQMGLVRDPELNAYVRKVGLNLLRYAPLSTFEYQFGIVDQFEPNAFALPGGHIYVSRGLLALADSEDELAGVLGHEITHASARHAAAQQEIAKRMNPLVMGWMRQGQLAAYGREQERDADRGGQRLAAAAGYDPAALTNFLQKLLNTERMLIGHSRLPSYFATHPGTSERVASTAARAQQLATGRPEASRPNRPAYLQHIQGLTLGTNPAEGVFVGDRFIHPDLGFTFTIPSGWQPVNSPQQVGAVAPRGDAFVFLSGFGPARDPKEAALEFVDSDEGKDMNFDVKQEQPVKVGDIDAYRIQGTGRMGSTGVAATMTFVPFSGATFRMVGVMPHAAAGRYLGRARSVASSFRPITQEERDQVTTTVLRIAQAEPGETLQALGQRVGNAYSPQQTAVLNGVFVDVVFQGGELVKVAQAKPYAGNPSAQASPGEAPSAGASSP